MTQIDTIMAHIDKMITPWIDKLLAIDKVVNGNGIGSGLKTKMAVTEKTIDTMQEDIAEIKGKLDKIQAGLLWGGIAIVVLQIVLKFI